MTIAVTAMATATATAGCGGGISCGSRDTTTAAMMTVIAAMTTTMATVASAAAAATMVTEWPMATVVVAMGAAKAALLPLHCRCHHCCHHSSRSVTHIGVEGDGAGGQLSDDGKGTNRGRIG